MIQNLSGIIIPNTIDEILERWDGGSSSKKRITLLYKDKEKIYCFLSNNLQEIRPENKIDVGITMAFSKRKEIDTHYDLIFHKREIKSGHYFKIEEDRLSKKNTRIMPFVYHNELPSKIINRNLEESLLNLIELKGKGNIKTLEEFAEHNFIKALFNFRYSKEWKDKRKETNERTKVIENEIRSLFKEDDSPSRFIQPTSYLENDRNGETMFVKKPLKNIKLFSLMPIFALTPYSLFISLIEELNGDYKKRYENSFNQSREEEIQGLISDFVIANPKAIGGVKKIYDLLKHTANISIYTAQLGITDIAYEYAPILISYPLIIMSMASGATMLCNFIRSKTRDSSGIISTIIDLSLFNRLK